MANFCFGEVEIVFDGHFLVKECFYSLYNALEVMEVKEAKEKFSGDLLKKNVKVRFDQFELSGVFIREASAKGDFYHIRFNEKDSRKRARINSFIDKHKVGKLWKRRYPRLDVNIGAGDTDVPSIAILGGKHQGNGLRVLNFTLDGILLEALGDQECSYEVGNSLILNLIISNGEELSNIVAHVARITEESSKKTEYNFCQIGLQIISMSRVVDEKYRAMIRDYCHLLKHAGGDK